ncbi:protein of unknown function [Methylocaldum szegediense]|uniref:Uncharacterized protein n=1 Tax=Methylocaldum szegediense TaxID=73780 RepID=A0ABM9I8S3_9GAMM|nr:protein of unknown function [Methylocaldum szegediense]
MLVPPVLAPRLFVPKQRLGNASSKDFVGWQSLADACVSVPNLTKSREKLRNLGMPPVQCRDALSVGNRLRPIHRPFK